MSSRIATLTLFAGMALTRPTHAQCISNASSCLNCHETQGSRSVLRGTQPWHVDHGFADLCVACHAGDPAALAKDAAHQGIRQPLLDPTGTCTGCHPSAATAFSARYRAAMRVPPSATSPSTGPLRPPPGLLEAVREHRADLVIVGTHGRHGVGRWLAGSIAETLVRSAECSVLVARPELPRERPRESEPALRAAGDPAPDTPPVEPAWRPRDRAEKHPVP